MRDRTRGLSEQIEQLVRDHIEAIRREATAAVERAFVSNRPQLRSAPSPARTRTAGRRRATTEVVALCERLYEAVRAQPGETMAVLAAELGKTPRELHRPMRVLKRAGRVRSVGQRNSTRYFPAVVRSA